VTFTTTQLSYLSQTCEKAGNLREMRRLLALLDLVALYEEE